MSITRSFANKVTADGVSGLDSTVITGATAETSIAGDDNILIYDDSATALRKMTRTNFVSGLTNTPAFFARRSNSSGNTLTLNVDTALVADSESFDTDNAYSTSTGKFIVPSGKDGKYFFHSTVAMAASYCGFTCFIYKNGSAFLRGNSVRIDASTMTVTGIMDLAVADEIQIFINADFSQAITGDSCFEGFKLI